MRKLVNSEAIAALLEVRLSTIRKWVFQKKIPFIKCGKLVRFCEHEIEQWLETKKAN